jgi:hypothetical protein
MTRHVLWTRESSELEMRFLTRLISKARLLAIAFGIALMAMLPLRQAIAVEAPANSLREIFARLNRCFYVESTGPVGSELTIQFSLKRNGELLGKPQITFAKFLGEWFEQRRFVASLAVAIDYCFPISITDALGGAIAGRQLYLRFNVRARDIDASVPKNPHGGACQAAIRAYSTAVAPVSWCSTFSGREARQLLLRRRVPWRGEL